MVLLKELHYQDIVDDMYSPLNIDLINRLGGDLEDSYAEGRKNNKGLLSIIEYLLKCSKDGSSQNNDLKSLGVSNQIIGILLTIFHILIDQLIISDRCNVIEDIYEYLKKFDEIVCEQRSMRNKLRKVHRFVSTLPIEAQEVLKKLTGSDFSTELIPVDPSWKWIRNNIYKDIIDYLQKQNNWYIFDIDKCKATEWYEIQRFELLIPRERKTAYEILFTECK